MENKSSDFIKNMVLQLENRWFWVKILGSSVVYLLITLWLNSIRTTATLWFIWVLIVIQFALYYSIFFFGYQRSTVFGLNKNLAFILFIILSILGRINDWELLVIPLLIVTMLVFSTMNKKVSEKGQTLLPKKI